MSPCVAAFRSKPLMRSARTRSSRLLVHAGTLNSGDRVMVVGSGNIGQLVTRRLIDNGYKVRALTRRPESAREQFGSANDNFEAVKADLKDASTLDGVFDGVDAVCLCTGTTAFPTDRWNGGNGPRTIDLVGPRNFIERMPRTLKRFVMLSSAGVDRYDQFPWFVLNAFGVLHYKKQTEELLRQSGVPYTIVRPGRMTGGPWTRDELDAVLRGNAAAQHSVMLSAADDQNADVLRILAAELMVQSLALDAAENKAIAINSKAGSGPGTESSKWRELIASLA